MLRTYLLVAWIASYDGLEEGRYVVDTFGTGSECAEALVDLVQNKDSLAVLLKEASCESFPQRRSE